MEPEDGFAVAAVGLGMYVVGGESAFRFCPKYPDINPTSVKDQIRDSQKEFYAIELSQNPILIWWLKEKVAAIKKYRIKDAEQDGTLNHLVSTYQPENDDIIPGLTWKTGRGL